MFGYVGETQDEVETTIRRELQRARLDVIEAAGGVSERVSGKMVGLSGELTFLRGWAHYIVRGKVPLGVARQLYADPIGVTDVRVTGHAGAPAPEHPWVLHFDADGKKLLPLSDEKPVAGPDASPEFRKLVEDVLASCRWVENPEAEAVESYVDTYHIDSMEGLRLFVDALRRPPAKFKVLPFKAFPQATKATRAQAVLARLMPLLPDALQRGTRILLEADPDEYDALVNNHPSLREPLTDEQVRAEMHKLGMCPACFGVGCDACAQSGAVAMEQA